jgi:hypothetical protein
VHVSLLGNSLTLIEQQGGEALGRGAAAPHACDMLFKCILHLIELLIYAMFAILAASLKVCVTALIHLSVFYC